MLQYAVIRINDGISELFIGENKRESMDTQWNGFEGDLTIQGDIEATETPSQEYSDLDDDASIEPLEATDDASEESMEQADEDASGYEELADPEPQEEASACNIEGLADEPKLPEDASLDGNDYEDLFDSQESEEIIENMDDSGLESEEEPEDLSDEEKAEIMKGFVDQNVSPAVLPAGKGYWKGEEGNSRWIPDKDATVTWRKGGETHVKAYGDIMKEQGIDGIEYFNKEPDFSDVEDSVIRHVELENFSDSRTGSSGTYSMASKAAAERLTRETGEVWTQQRVQEYMNDHGLTWHECADRKTVRAIPTEINAGFKHTGGISMEKSVSAAAESLDERVGLGKGFSMERESSSQRSSADSEELDAAIQASKDAYRDMKRLQNRKGD